MIRFSPDPIVKHPQGSSLILVVVSLVLMTMLGVTYVHTSRLQRQVTAVQTRSSSKIDSNVDAVIQQIQHVLRDDLLDGNGQFFNATPPADTTDPNDPNVDGGDEPFDYPYTGPMPTPVNERWKATKLDGTQVDAAGGYNDDTWLASTTPTFPGGNTTWPHITNLNGLFLHNGTNGDLTTGSALPAQIAVTNIGTTEKWDTDVLESSAYLVDADGDGIKDSRWTWAPIKKIGSVAYVMAVRIIDNSSLVNANVATSMTDSSGLYDSSLNGDHSPRWWSPADLDLGQFVNSHVGLAPVPLSNQTSFMSNLAALLNHKMGSNAMPSPWGTLTNQRHHYWLNGPAMYENFSLPYGYESFGIKDELELRYRNGLNNLNATATIEDMMPELLRRDETELAYDDVTGISTLQLQDHFEINPRSQITVMSGSAIYAPPLPGETSRKLKTDLNIATTAELSAEIQAVFDVGTFTLPVEVAAATTQELADQFAVCIKDYADADNKLSERNGRYGMEALPFITEVYVQRKYKITGATALPSPPASANSWDVTWVQDSGIGFAIEIRNPFRQPIKLTDVNLFVNGSDWGSLDTLAGATTLGVDQALILYRNSGSTGDDVLTSMWSSDPLIVLDTSIANTWPTTAGPVTLELRATDGLTSNPLTWAYAAATYDGNVPTNDANQVTSIATPGIGHTDYLQFTALGNGNGLNMLEIQSTHFVIKKEEPDPGNSSRQNIDSLGDADKTPNGGPGGNTSSLLANQQILIRDSSTDEVAQVGELAHIAMFGPDATNTVAQRWNGATDVTAFMLDFASTELVSTNSNSFLAVPHAVVMLDRFTTLSPAVDGKDNDGDGTSDTLDVPDDEQFVPGSININTVSADLLLKVAPIPDGTIATNVIDGIMNYRDKLDVYNFANRGAAVALTNYRDGPGIAMIGELMEVVDRNNPSSVKTIDALAKDAAENTVLNGTVVDFLPNPPTLTTPNHDTIIDDREEETMMARWLGQVCTTRSDIFTAYVVIQGFSSDDFRTGAVESARFFAIFDRSRITGAGDAVRVLGVHKMN